MTSPALRRRPAWISHPRIGAERLSLLPVRSTLDTLCLHVSAARTRPCRQPSSHPRVRHRGDRAERESGLSPVRLVASPSTDRTEPRRRDGDTSGSRSLRKCSPWATFNQSRKQGHVRCFAFWTRETCRDGRSIGCGSSPTRKPRHKRVFAWHALAIQIEAESVNLIVGRVFELRAQSCGDENVDDALSAADALATLLAAVGVSECEPCTCDADGSTTIAARDARMLLEGSSSRVSRKADNVVYLDRRPLG